jgi:uracil-DNA glycosylase
MAPRAETVPETATVPPTGDNQGPKRRVRINPVEVARQAAAAASDLAHLKIAIAEFEHCPLKAAARNTVVFDGQVDAPVMLVGEAPGMDEDAQGLPFVGRSGRLLDRMLESVGVSRKTNLYITNLIYWRPPGNRDPTPEEIEMCAPFLARQIALKKPRLLLTVGKPATQTLLRTSEGITRLRGQRTRFLQDGLDPVPCLPLLHPSYLLRRPQDKPRAWADMLTLAGLCDELGLTREGAL